MSKLNKSQKVTSIIAKKVIILGLAYLFSNNLCMLAYLKMVNILSTYQYYEVDK